MDLGSFMDPSWILHGSFRLSSAEALLLEQLSLNIGVQLFDPMSKGAGLAGRGNPMEIPWKSLSFAVSKLHRFSRKTIVSTSNGQCFLRKWMKNDENGYLDIYIYSNIIWMELTHSDTDP